MLRMLQRNNCCTRYYYSQYNNFHQSLHWYVGWKQVYISDVAVCLSSRLAIKLELLSIWRAPRPNAASESRTDLSKGPTTLEQKRAKVTTTWPQDIYLQASRDSRIRYLSCFRRYEIRRINSFKRIISTRTFETYKNLSNFISIVGSDPNYRKLQVATNCPLLLVDR